MTNISMLVSSLLRFEHEPFNSFSKIVRKGKHSPYNYQQQFLLGLIAVLTPRVIFQV